MEGGAGGPAAPAAPSLPPRDPFISDSSRRCQGSPLMRDGIACTTASHCLVLAKRALRIAVLPTAMPSCSSRISATSASDMRLRYLATLPRARPPSAVFATVTGAPAFVTSPQAMHIVMGRNNIMQTAGPAPPILATTLPRLSTSMAPASSGFIVARSLLSDSSHTLLRWQPTMIRRVPPHSGHSVGAGALNLPTGLSLLETPLRPGCPPRLRTAAAGPSAEGSRPSSAARVIALTTAVNLAA